MKVIYNVLSVSQIKLLSKSFDPDFDKVVNLIAVGSLLPVKGYDRLIDACQIMNRRDIDFQLRILGRGPLRNELLRQIDNLELNDRIELLDFVENPYPYVMNSDIFVMTSYSEALPTSLCEAIILGKPVCVTNVSGCREVIDSGRYGLMVEGSPESIAVGLESLILNEHTRESYANLSCERSLIFSDEKVLEEIYELFEI